MNKAKDIFTGTFKMSIKLEKFSILPMMIKSFSQLLKYSA